MAGSDRSRARWSVVSAVAVEKGSRGKSDCASGFCDEAVQVRLYEQEQKDVER